MWRALLRDPASLRAYLLTKVGVLAVAAVATWPLARLLGPRAWWGLGFFAAFLTLVTVVVVALARTASPVASGQDDDEPSGGFAENAVVTLEVEDSLDLHSFPPAEVPGVVEAYLEVAGEKGFTEVRLIHGRGIGVQRERVRSLLSRHPLVTGFHDALPERGGWGATVVYLRAAGAPGSAVTVPGERSPASERGGKPEGGT